MAGLREIGAGTIALRGKRAKNTDADRSGQDQSVDTVLCGTGDGVEIEFVIFTADDQNCRIQVEADSQSLSAEVLRTSPDIRLNNNTSCRLPL
jgi:hypothetical protein